MKTLILVDLQNDFAEGGSLAVKGAEGIIPVINKLTNSGKFDRIIATQDWHPEGHISFASKYNVKPFSVVRNNIVWPDHCIAGTKGADFISELDQSKIETVVRKGMNPLMDSYSGFLENDGKTITALNDLALGDVYICGLASDVCVYHTAIDSKKYFYYNTYVISNACIGIDKEKTDKCFTDMRNKGIHIVTSSSILDEVRD